MAIHLRIAESLSLICQEYLDKQVLSMPSLCLTFLPADILTIVTNFLSAQDVAVLFQAGARVLNDTLTTKGGFSTARINGPPLDIFPVIFRWFASLKSYSLDMPPELKEFASYQAEYVPGRVRHLRLRSRRLFAHLLSSRNNFNFPLLESCELQEGWNYAVNEHKRVDGTALKSVFPEGLKRLSLQGYISPDIIQHLPRDIETLRLAFHPRDRSKAPWLVDPKFPTSFLTRLRLDNIVSLKVPEFLPNNAYTKLSITPSYALHHRQDQNDISGADMDFAQLQWERILSGPCRHTLTYLEFRAPRLSASIL